jgi:hypothetical protein
MGEVRFDRQGSWSFEVCEFLRLVYRIRLSWSTMEGLAPCFRLYRSVTMTHSAIYIIDWEVAAFDLLSLGPPNLCCRLKRAGGGGGDLQALVATRVYQNNAMKRKKNLRCSWLGHPSWSNAVCYSYGQSLCGPVFRLLDALAVMYSMY